MHADRRTVLTLLAGALAMPDLVVPAAAYSPGMSRTAFVFAFVGLTGDPIRLVDNAGKPILIVNTASLCGYTPQYAGLQQLWKRFHDRGLMIIGVPSNDFGGQEPGGATDIIHTAHEEYGVTFPLAQKAVVKGENAHPFYKWAALERPADVPQWNFHKYLIGRNGQIAAVFASAIEPTDPRIVAAIEQQLGEAKLSR